MKIMSFGALTMKVTMIPISLGIAGALGHLDVVLLLQQIPRDTKRGVVGLTTFREKYFSRSGKSQGILFQVRELWHFLAVLIKMRWIYLF